MRAILLPSLWVKGHRFPRRVCQSVNAGLRLNLPGRLLTSVICVNRSLTGGAAIMWPSHEVDAGSAGVGGGLTVRGGAGGGEIM